ACQRNGAQHQAGARIETKGVRQTHAEQVLQHDIAGGESQQNGQSLAALEQSRQIGTQADGGEEIQQQQVAYAQAELHLQVEAVVEQCGARGADEAADHRLRDRSEEHTSELQSRENLVCRL